jgi:putative hydrolase of the HAD superfamily
VAFDLDGTLYPNYRFYGRIVPLVLRDWPLMIAFARAREQLHAETHEAWANFYEVQATLMAKMLRQDVPTVQAKTERLIYRSWEPLFKRIALHNHVRETLAAFRDAGLKLGLLSDFPPERKLEYLGLSGMWDAVLCSEATGHLKPDSVPFRELERQLNVPAPRILYVGNSVRYDVNGAHKAGMKTALITARKTDVADFTFTDYRDLRRYVLDAPPC